MQEFKLLIGGKMVPGDDQMDVINPATEQVFATCPRASISQLDRAVAAAKAAQKEWSALPFEERRKSIVRIADVIEANIDELARLLTQEQGKPLTESTSEIGYAASIFRNLDGLNLDNEIRDDSASRCVEIRRRPLGVVGCIIPWNFPILLISFKVPLALLAGNTVVLKPSPTTPLATLRLGELLRDMLPPGVINVITDLNDLGAAMSSHPDIAKISFTGSTETGKRVMASAASTIKRLTLELGGNDAAIVMADADPKEIAPKIYGSAFLNAGQTCIAIKRVYAHEDIYDELCDELAALASASVVDDGMKQGAECGPLQNKAQFEKVKYYLQNAIESGKVIAGGDIPERPGYFISPTVVRDVSDGTAIVDEEQFGPILPVIRFADVDHVMAVINNSTLGLGGSIWSNDQETAYKHACKMEAGTVWINKHLEFGPGVPFCGAKQSGFGSEFGQESLHDFTQIQVINQAK
ncbi:aldehyde dehydrogenase family protein [Paracoccus versutus]|uniref:Acyl-CoA reductase-like NAD-dependent aldehyde dehydrogenase n=1 Tax=Paracoccus versutus TaxID=34007 RepID=A0A3D9XYP0_PARVE|nr:aldehyde dehydrogenase family protein [Paracoccus versutus]REF73392.1 acyl-CoA reductase-like NAD-dependent aldehyde dehydrogenase [Paracoccus versutus]WGR54588.1 aldehyde dehydrogenase family protein [Paracoccus versutus]